jgi:hypothetical protein
MIGIRNWQILNAGCRHLKTVRYVARNYLDKGNYDTVLPAELISTLQTHSSSLETLEMNYQNLLPGSYNNEASGVELQPFTNLSRLAISQNLFGDEPCVVLLSLPPSVQIFSLIGIVDLPVAIFEQLWNMREIGSIPALHQVEVLTIHNNVDMLDSK